MRIRYEFCVFGYVVMPEHVHLLVSEPKWATLAKAIQALKLSVSVQRHERPFWQARYYDFNVFTQPKHVEKLKYMHRNPVRRELVKKPEDWTWSSYMHYLTGQPGMVEIESWWMTPPKGIRLGRIPGLRIETWGTLMVIHLGLWCYAMASRPMGSKRSWLLLRSTSMRTCAPCSISPLRILIASGSCTMRCRARLSGRAP